MNGTMHSVRVWPLIVGAAGLLSFSAAQNPAFHDAPATARQTAPDGSLLVTEDASGSIWGVSYTGK